MIVFSTGDILTGAGLGLDVVAYGLRELENIQYWAYKSRIAEGS